RAGSPGLAPARARVSVSSDDALASGASTSFEPGHRSVCLLSSAANHGGASRASPQVFGPTRTEREIVRRARPVSDSRRARAGSARAPWDRWSAKIRGCPYITLRARAATNALRETARARVLDALERRLSSSHGVAAKSIVGGIAAGGR